MLSKTVYFFDDFYQFYTLQIAEVFGILLFDFSTISIVRLLPIFSASLQRVGEQRLAAVNA